MNKPAHRRGIGTQESYSEGPSHEAGRTAPSLGVFLVFNDRFMEEEAARSASLGWTNCDKVTWKLSMLITLPKILSFSSSSITSACMHAFLLIVFGFIIPAKLLLSIVGDPRGYSSNRTRIVTLVKLVLALGHCMIVSTEDPFDVWDADDLPHLLVRGFSRNSFVPVIFLALGIPLPFLWHVAVQGLICFTATPWVLRLSHVCNQVPKVSKAISHLGDITEGYLSFLSTSSISEGSGAVGVHSCKHVASFYAIFWQFLIPTYLLYLLESRMRLQFLSEKTSEDEVALLPYVKYGHMALATAALLLGSQLAWFSVNGLVD